MSDDYIVEITETPSDPLGGASGEKRRFQVEFLGKTDNSAFPYTVANEVVAAQIGMALGLNVPTVLTHSIQDADYALVQMVGSDPNMQQPPPATAAALSEFVATHPDEVHAAIVFDLYLANNDRAFGPVRRNVKLDVSGRLLLYDNGNACFYRNRSNAGIQAGIPRLEAVESNFAEMFDMDHKQNHYREFLTDWELVDQWCGRIAALPDFLIESAVQRIPPTSASAADRVRLAGFLISRKDILREEIYSHKDLFPGLPDTELQP